ncbi:MAG: exosortase system-associated protein, TIGR04073 family [Methylococcaceae bacterium]|nr:exosortase system-associated protein, TIGR04073 family [Methylococcaceae bacterium]
MKFAIFAATLLTGLSTATYANHHAERPSQGYPSAIAEKLGGGVVNAATGWVEIPHTLYAASNQDGPALGLTLGFFKGVVHTLGRSLNGVMDIVTFPIPSKPMINPHFVWENFERETSYNSTWELYNTR